MAADPFEFGKCSFPLGSAGLRKSLGRAWGELSEDLGRAQEELGESLGRAWEELREKGLGNGFWCPSWLRVGLVSASSGHPGPSEMMVLVRRAAVFRGKRPSEPMGELF